MATSLRTLNWHRPFRRALCALPILALSILATLPPARESRAADAVSRFMIEATVRGRHLEGAPLTWSDEKVWLLARDGRLWDFAPGDATNYRKTASYFTPYSALEMEAQLQTELGRRFEVTATAHYLVCHPPGQAANWGDRFEQMYRQFGHYFSVRGLNLRQPEMPMVAIVFTERTDFLHYSLGDNFRPGPAVLGYYSPRTNRVAMFDGAASHPSPGDWRQSAAMLVHEAAHQAAFNTGVHTRLNSPPQWLAEGLATLFEARGVWNSDEYRQLSDRVNQGRMNDFRHFAAGQSLARLDSIAGDFRSRVHARPRDGVCPKLGADVLPERKRAVGLQQIFVNNRRPPRLPQLPGNRPHRRFFPRLRRQLENARRPRAAVHG